MAWRWRLALLGVALLALVCAFLAGSTWQAGRLPQITNAGEIG